MIDPHLIGKVDPASKDVREKEDQLQREEERLRKFKNKRKKNTQRLKDHIAKDVFKDQMRREHVVADRRIRKQFYQAEMVKTEREGRELESNMAVILKQSGEFIKSLK